MRVIHRISVVDESERREALASLGVAFETPGRPLVRILCFDIDETDPKWIRLRQLIPKWNTEDGCDPLSLGIVRTEFSKKELQSASFHQLFAWLHGYPQPQDDFGYRKETYDLSEYCPTCGIGKKQIAPFRMKGEPKWGKKHFLQLNWVFDEFFVLPKVWEEVFEPLGVGCSPVIEHRTGKTLRTVVQLDIKNVATSALSLKGCASEVCGTCGRKKYLPISNGFFPAFVADPRSPLCKTQEFFGSGASGWNAVIAREVYRAIQVHKLAGLTFIPMAQPAPADPA
jgi:rRNA maturation protein Nop10